MKRTLEKLPPMAQAIRAFMVEMDFPTEPKKSSASGGLKLKVPAANKTGPSPNIKYAAVLQALLNSAKRLGMDATEVTVAPPLKQLMAICHCAERSMQRILEELEAEGIIARNVRGAHLSTVYTVYKYTKILKDAQTGKPYFSHSRHDNLVTPRHDNLVTSENASGVTTQDSGVTTGSPRGDNVVILRSKSLGSKSLGEAPSVFLDSNNGPVPQPAESADNGSATLSSNGAPQHEVKIECLVGRNLEFFCPRCNEVNGGVTHQHECSRCLNTINSALFRARTAEEGRLHMVLQLEKLPLDVDARKKFYRDLTATEFQWVKDCGMVYAAEMLEMDEADKRQALIDAAIANGAEEQ